MRLTQHRRGYYALAAITALFLMSGYALAAASFTGQGTVPFDSIRVGKNDKNSQIQLQGPILNPGTYPDGKQRPLNISDNLAIKGDLMILSNKALKAEGSNWLNVTSPLNVTKAAAFSSNVVIAGTLAAATGGFTGNAAVGGNLGVTGTSYLNHVDVAGALTAGPYNVGTTIVSNAGLTNRLSGMVSCVGTFAQFTVSVESDDYIFCFNTWMAGQPGSVSFSSLDGLTDLQRNQVEQARTQLSGDPVTSLPVTLAPIR